MVTLLPPATSGSQLSVTNPDYLATRCQHPVCTPSAPCHVQDSCRCVKTSKRDTIQLKSPWSLSQGCFDVASSPHPPSLSLSMIVLIPSRSRNKKKHYCPVQYAPCHQYMHHRRQSAAGTPPAARQRTASTPSAARQQPVSSPPAPSSLHCKVAAGAKMPKRDAF